VIEQLIDGLGVGGVYALFGMGFGLIFSTMGILNLAQGVYATWGAIIGYWFASKYGFPFGLALVAGGLSGGLLALVVDRVAFQPIRKRGKVLLGALITSIGAWIALEQLASVATGAAVMEYPNAPTGLLKLGSISILEYQLIAILLAAALAIILSLLFKYSLPGRALRAVGSDSYASSLGGINVRTIVVGTALLAGLLTGMAGVLQGVATNVTFSMGDNLLLDGFAAVVLGGMGSIGATAVGGFAIGIIQVLSGRYISQEFQNTITFGLIFIILVVRPERSGTMLPIRSYISSAGKMMHKQKASVAGSEKLL